MGGKEVYLQKSCYKCKATTATALIHRGGHLWIGKNTETCRKCPNGCLPSSSKKLRKLNFHKNCWRNSGILMSHFFRKSVWEDACRKMEEHPNQPCVKFRESSAMYFEMNRKFAKPTFSRGQKKYEGINVRRGEHLTPDTTRFILDLLRVYTIYECPSRLDIFI